VYRGPYVSTVHYGYGVSYGGIGWLGPDYLDPGYYDNSYQQPVDPSLSQAQPYYPGDVPQAGYGAGPAGPPAGDAYRPAYAAPASPAPVNEETVTLVFKDGRPSEQIHNYILTPTTLLVQDGRRREIPVEQLDAAATRKANLDAGVDFRLPAAGK
jgi:hypothetical protein